MGQESPSTLVSRRALVRNQYISTDNEALMYMTRHIGFRWQDIDPFGIYPREMFMSALGRMRCPRLSSHVWSHWPRFVNETILNTVATSETSRFANEPLARGKGESSLLISYVLSVRDL